MAFGSGGQEQDRPGGIKASQVRVTVEPPHPAPVQSTQPVAGLPKDFAAPVRHGAAGAGARYLTVREVAAHLCVSTATVYGLCPRGQLRYIRVSGAIRIDSASLDAFTASAS